jgi:multidrug efflux pump subunit AcrA (membrane-fusion protein)
VHGEAAETFVYVVTGERFEQRAVVTGRRSPDLIEIRSGVAPGERISLVAPAGRS